MKQETGPDNPTVAVQQERGWANQGEEGVAEERKAPGAQLSHDQRNRKLAYSP